MKYAKVRKGANMQLHHIIKENTIKCYLFLQRDCPSPKWTHLLQQARLKTDDEWQKIANTFSPYYQEMIIARYKNTL